MISPFSKESVDAARQQMKEEIGRLLDEEEKVENSEALDMLAIAFQNCAESEMTAMGNINYNFPIFAAYFHEKNPTINEIRNAILEMVSLTFKTIYRLQISTIVEKTIGREMTKEEDEKIYTVVAERAAEMMENSQTMKENIAAIVNAGDIRDVLQMISRNEGPISQYLQGKD